MGIGGSVDDHRDLTFFDSISNVRTPVLNLFHNLRRNTPRFKMARGSSRRDDLESNSLKLLRDRSHTRFVLVAHANEDSAGLRQAHADAELSLSKGQAERGINPHYFAGRFHLRTEQRIDTRKFIERKNSFFDRNMLRQEFQIQ